MNPAQSNNRMRPMKVSRWLTRRRRCAQTGAPGLHRRFVLHPTCLSEANITLFVRLSAPVPCAAALLDMSSSGDHFLPVSGHFLGRWVGLWAYRCFEGVGWCWEVPSAAWREARRPLGLVLSLLTLSLTQSIWASIRCLRMGWMAGGKYFGVWTVSKGMGKVRGSVLCAHFLVPAPVCCSSH